ncbi:glycosyltransferase [uncultured Tateyamaria sp.]|uniref:glycosyltransferase n=1 Tax=uncultured Tateyamaria sp. TaxID=455651 RepID=UPI0026212096|nr:glycosyltransferase [uncultured Tateyamaria sp.]
MKLLIIQAGFGAGGAEKIVAMIAAHRARLGDEVHVAAMTCPPEGSYFEYPEGVSLHVLDPPQPRRARLSMLRRTRAIRALIRTHEPDVVVSFLTKINVQTLIAALGTYIPVIVSERNNVQAQAAHPFWRHAQSALMPQAARIVMQTKRACRDVPTRARDNAHVIPNPCAPRAGQSDPPVVNPPRLAAVGRLSHQKGFDLLLRAMALLHGQHPDLRLTIYGEGEQRAALEAQRTALGLEHVVDLPGNSTTPGAWIADTDILVLSSRYEGFPNVVAEGLVNARPVVAFDCDFGPQELIEDGVNGRLVPQGDVMALAEALGALAAAPRMRAAMAQNATALRVRLDPAIIMAQWDDVIADAAATARHARGHTSVVRSYPQSER